MKAGAVAQINIVWHPTCHVFVKQAYCLIWWNMQLSWAVGSVQIYTTVAAAFATTAIYLFFFLVTGMLSRQ